MPAGMSLAVGERQPGEHEPAPRWAIPSSGVRGAYGISDPSPAAQGSRIVSPHTNDLWLGVTAPTADRTGTEGDQGIFTPASGNIGDRVLVPSLIAGAAKVAVALGEHRAAAQLFGAAEHLRGFTTTLHRPGRWILYEHRYDENVAAVRATLGNAPFDTEYAAGQAASIDAAIIQSLQILDTARASLT
jgi:hypothetical protein